MKQDISIMLRDIHIVRSAEIKLNGVTILTGENGCGKTTISKVLYNFIRTSIDFDKIILQRLSIEASKALRFLDEFIPRKDNKKQLPYPFNDNLANLNTIADFESVSDKILDISHKYDTGEYKLGQRSLLRLRALYISMTEKEDGENNTDSKNLNTPQSILEDYVETLKTILDKYLDIIHTHNKVIFDSTLSDLFNEDASKLRYNYSEFDVPLINSNNVKIQKAFSNAIYIDVPTALDLIGSNVRLDYPKNKIIQDLSTMIYNQNTTRSPDATIINDFTNALNGTIGIEESVFSKQFLYASKDGRSLVPLSQAASGIKCIATIERLYTNGWLDNSTLLIIDEPEIHLHPALVVDFARLIITLHKKLGVTVVLASHNPDFVSAIKYISHKECCDESLSFYLAQKISEEEFGKYDFKPLGNDIEPIFASFNIALDRIDQYGASDDEEDSNE